MSTNPFSAAVNGNALIYSGIEERADRHRYSPYIRQIRHFPRWIAKLGSAVPLSPYVQDGLYDRLHWFIHHDTYRYRSPKEVREFVTGLFPTGVELPVIPAEETIPTMKEKYAALRPLIERLYEIMIVQEVAAGQDIRLTSDIMSPIIGSDIMNEIRRYHDDAFTLTCEELNYLLRTYLNDPTRMEDDQTSVFGGFWTHFAPGYLYAIHHVVFGAVRTRNFLHILGTFVHNSSNNYEDGQIRHIPEKEALEIVGRLSVDQLKSAIADFFGISGDPFPGASTVVDRAYDKIRNLRANRVRHAFVSAATTHPQTTDSRRVAHLPVAGSMGFIGADTSQLGLPDTLSFGRRSKFGFSSGQRDMILRELVERIRESAVLYELEKYIGIGGCRSEIGNLSRESRDEIIHLQRILRTEPGDSSPDPRITKSTPVQSIPQWGTVSRVLFDCWSKPRDQRDMNTLLFTLSHDFPYQTYDALQRTVLRQLPAASPRRLLGVVEYVRKPRLQESVFQNHVEALLRYAFMGLNGDNLITIATLHARDPRLAAQRAREIIDEINRYDSLTADAKTAVDDVTLSFGRRSKFGSSSDQRGMILRELIERIHETADLWDLGTYIYTPGFCRREVEKLTGESKNDMRRIREIFNTNYGDSFFLPDPIITKSAPVRSLPYWDTLSRIMFDCWSSLDTDSETAALATNLSREFPYQTYDALQRTVLPQLPAANEYENNPILGDWFSYRQYLELFLRYAFMGLSGDDLFEVATLHKLHKYKNPGLVEQRTRELLDKTEKLTRTHRAISSAMATPMAPSVPYTSTAAAIRSIGGIGNLGLPTTLSFGRRRVIPMNTFVKKYCSKFGRSRRYAIAKYKKAMSILF